MAESFDQILDECLDRIILYNESVEDCLARYPDMADALEPHIRLASQFDTTYQFTPNTNAKAKGRVRLQAELAALEQQGASQGKMPWWVWLANSWRQRFAAAAIALVMVVLVSGAGTVWASESALPGDPLYLVKRITESARLALEFSEVDRAKLHLAFAERRADEMNSLIKRGNFSQLQAVQASMQQSLSAAAAIIGTLQNGQLVASLNSQLENSALRVLSRFQLTLRDVPTPSQVAASDSFQASSEAFGNAIEVAASQSSNPSASADIPGSIRVWAADPPSPEVDSVQVQVKNIEAYLAGGDGSQWIALASGPYTFDLLQVAKSAEFLHETDVEPGTYTKVRFFVTRTTVVEDGDEYVAVVPGDPLTLVRPFQVKAGKTTDIYLDFDGTRSLTINGNGQYVMNPLVRILARAPSDLGGSDDDPDNRQNEPTATPPNSSQPVNSETEEIELEGIIQSVISGALVVNDERVLLDEDTSISGNPHEGAHALIEALSRGSSLVAISVEVTASEEGNQNRYDGPSGTPVTINGAIQAVGTDRWTVGGQEVLLTPDTRIFGEGVVGGTASVKGAERPDGMVVAERITVTSQVLTRTPTPTSGASQESEYWPSGKISARLSGNLDFLYDSVWAVEGVDVVVEPDTEVKGNLAQGAKVSVSGIRKSDDRIIAEVIRVLAPPEDDEPERSSPPIEETPTPEAPVQVRMEGVLMAVKGAEGWRVDGNLVQVPDAEIKAKVVKGATVVVEGVRMSDGTIRATEITVQEMAEEQAPEPESEDVTIDRDQAEGDRHAPPESDGPGLDLEIPETEDIIDLSL